MKRIIFFIISITILSIISFQADAVSNNKFSSIKLEGTVNPIISDHIVKSIEKANEEKTHFIVIKMDTPGGMMTSMREIIKAILSSKVPVVVYTYPKGAQAASAGGYIMLSAHVAAMAPGTEIGAMHPVSPMLNFGQKNEKGESEEGVMEKKVLNDTVAYARSLAQKRNRNINWVERAVKDAISSTYIEAINQGVIDIIAEDMNDLLKKLNGMSVNVDGYPVLLNTTNIIEVPYEMDWKQKFFNFFADPQVVFLLFIIAVIGIGMEFKNPGMILPGTAGAVSFFIFLMAVRVLPINAAGLALIILSIVLFILELNIGSYGLLTAGGIASFVLGSMMLFDSELPGFQVPLSSIVGVIIFLLLFFFVVVRSVIAVHKGRVTTGMQAFIGDTGIAAINFKGEGKIMIHGEYWNARLLSEDDIKKDDHVIVVDTDGMTLIVKRKPAV